MALTLEEAETFLTQRISLGRGLVEQPIADIAELERLDAQAKIWSDFNQEWVKKYLPFDVSLRYSTYRKVRINEPILGTNYYAKDFLAQVKDEITALESLIQRLPLWTSAPEEKAPEPSQSKPKEEAPAPSPPPRQRLDAPIFIVHGSDTNRAQLVARAVERATGREVIILREQPNGGRTLIEKFEDHAQNASYAIVLVTADDQGGRKDGPISPRGRQNVIFEMGFFYGQIGRSRVSVLLDPGVEQPSDMSGIVYINFDNNNAWKLELFREMQHAGFVVDWSRVPS